MAALLRSPVRQTPTPRETAFGRMPSGTDLFAVNADTPVREALEQVVMNL
jgi:hypothetical protein